MVAWRLRLRVIKRIILRLFRLCFQSFLFPSSFFGCLLLRFSLLFLFVLRKGISQHLEPVSELLDGPHDDGIFVEVLDADLEFLINLICNVVFQINATLIPPLQLRILISQTHPQLVSKILLSIKRPYIALTRHLNIALLKLDIFAHHDAYHIGLFNLLRHRGKLKEDLLWLFLNECFFLLYLLLQFILLRFILLLSFNLLLFNFFLNLH